MISVQKLMKNPRVNVRICLYTGKFPVVHSRKHSHPINVSVSGSYVYKCCKLCFPM